MSLLDQLTPIMASQMAPQAAQKTGLSQDLTEKMLPIAMAAVMSGLKKNTSDPRGAEALSNALDRHDGSLLDNISQVSNDSILSDGHKILGHILGGKQAQTERALAKTAGVEPSQIGQLLAMAAPAVLAALGREKRQRSLDVSDLAGVVRQETDQVQRAAPGELGGLLQFLDRDGDGDFKDDLLESAGKQLLGGLFGRK